MTMIRELREDELEAAGLLAAHAFVGDPGFDFVVGADQGLLAPLLGVSVTLDYHGGAKVLGAFGKRLEGWVSVYPPEAEPPGTLAWFAHLPALRRFLIRPGAMLRGLTFQTMMDQARPKGPSFLKMLAVEPGSQGRGVGKSLIEAACAGRDAVYLETSKESNRAYYVRRGFAPVKTLERTGFPPIWTLLRRS